MPMDEILKMIEEVDPNNAAKLDEIDARVLCYLHNEEFLSFEPWGWSDDLNNIDHTAFVRAKSGKEFVFTDLRRHFLYTRSRDALKAIRPEGYQFDIEGIQHKYVATICKSPCPSSEYIFDSEELPTEELAELHAIIQAINYERLNNEHP